MKVSWGRLGPVWLATAVACVTLMLLDPPGAAAATPQGLESSPQASAEAGSLGLGDSIEEAQRRSAGCVTCHNPMDSPTMHTTGTVHLGCIDCHGGDSQIALPAGIVPASPQYRELTRQAHPRPRFAENARSSANPVCSYTNWLKEDADYVKF